MESALLATSRSLPQLIGRAAADLTWYTYTYLTFVFWHCGCRVPYFCFMHTIAIVFQQCVVEKSKNYL